MRKTIAALFAGATLFAGLAGTASAQQQDGLVNVIVGDVTILEDVNVAVAANVAAQICGVNVGPAAVAVLGRAIAVDRGGRTATICDVDGQSVQIAQN
jgi:hypothetical protein